MLLASAPQLNNYKNLTPNLVVPCLEGAEPLLQGYLVSTSSWTLDMSVM